MPANTIYVGRGSMWGNYAAFRHSVIKGPEAVKLFCEWVENEASEAWKGRAQIELRGKNLACWCKPTERCHADVLLRLVNG
jgi:hypothetical protein